MGVISDLVKVLIERGSSGGMTKIQFLEAEIKAWKKSDARKWQLIANAYYDGDHDILQRKREAIGEDGQLIEVTNLPNNREVDNQYEKAVDQKVNYSFARPFTMDCDNKAYLKALGNYVDDVFRLQISDLGHDAISGGVAWLYPYYDEEGKLSFKRYDPWEILPFWSDKDHTKLDAFVRLYEVHAYDKGKPITIEKVQFVSADGIENYILTNNGLIEDVENPFTPHFTAEVGGRLIPLNWTKVPLIAWKFNKREKPLIKRVKGLQDAINMIKSDWLNNMQEDHRNTILVIHNYDGTDLGKLRQNLATFGAIKVRSIDGVKGGVSALKVEVNAENYIAIDKVLKDALIENARALDAKMDKGGDPNQMNIQSMYTDMDLDANGMEQQFKASFKNLLFFINFDIAKGQAHDFDKEKVTIMFNRDVLINESQVIQDCVNSKGTVSDETILNNHPWVEDVAAEMQRLKKQQQSEADMYLGKDPVIENE